MHSLLSGTTEKWKGYWLPWVVKIFLTCLFPGFSTSGSCEVWNWPRRGNSRKGNSHFEKSLTDLPNPTLPETWAVVCHLVPPCSDLPLLPFQHHTVCSALSLQETDTGAGPHLWFVNQLWQLPAGLQRERCCGAWLQWGCSSKVREFLVAFLCFSTLLLLRWDVWSCPLSSHLVDPNKLREFSVFYLLMPSNVSFFSPSYTVSFELCWIALTLLAVSGM